MEVSMFSEELKRMCKSLGCKKCPVCGSNGICRILSPLNIIGEVVPIVEKWSKEHPQKTRTDDFKEKYPNAHLDAHGFPDFCCAKLGYVCNCEKKTCEECWNTPIDD